MEDRSSLRPYRSEYRYDLLPDLVVERIFCYLPKRSRYEAAQTCKAWLRVLYFPALWKTFTLREKTLTRSRFDYYKGPQDCLSHILTKACLKRVGRHFRRIKVQPIANFLNLFEFMGLVDSYIKFFVEAEVKGEERYPLPHLVAFEFSFACQIRNRESIRVFGTGGKILETLTTLLGSFQGLKELRLENLLLDRFEAPTLLNSIYESCSESLVNLSILNCAQFNYYWMHCGLFLNLRCLTVSANHLHTDLIYLVGNLDKLAEFHVVQTEFTRAPVVLTYYDWEPMRTTGKSIRMFLEARGKTKEELAWQERAPVFAVAYSTPYARLSPQTALEIIHQYGSTLTAYCQFGLPRFPYKRNRPFDSRCDSQLLLMVRTCNRLRTVVIHELICISTLLLLVHYGKDHLRELYVRRNAVLRRDDWKSDSDSLTEEFKAWLRLTSKSYDTFEEEISRMWGKRWRALSDLEFRQLKLSHLEM
ncbi:hypothetical protein BV898_12603 [Hypsibius exemplaris]|uniref:F-box domain-containing protein n=1 Tax=Hypsibius exemplaris TaxID=2072580 RepID=A0A1W0WD89_HYPEX|nr:hypothetical protein BV898_12603 [Hypsibius exemplaris]